MKSLISLTPTYFKSNYERVLAACTEMCVTTGEDVVIAIAEENSVTHTEVARIAIKSTGIDYSFNKELLKSLQLENICVTKREKLQHLIKKAYRKSGMLSRIEKSLLDKFTNLLTEYLIKEFEL